MICYLQKNFINKKKNFLFSSSSSKFYIFVQSLSLSWFSILHSQEAKRKRKLPNSSGAGGTGWLPKGHCVFIKQSLDISSMKKVQLSFCQRKIDLVNGVYSLFSCCHPPEWGSTSSSKSKKVGVRKMPQGGILLVGLNVERGFAFEWTGLLEKDRNS